MLDREIALSLLIVVALVGSALGYLAFLAADRLSKPFFGAKETTQGPHNCRLAEALNAAFIGAGIVTLFDSDFWPVGQRAPCSWIRYHVVNPVADRFKTLCPARRTNAATALGWIVSKYLGLFRPSARRRNRRRAGLYVPMGHILVVQTATRKRGSGLR